MFSIDYIDIKFNINFNNNYNWLLILTKKKQEQLFGEVASILHWWKLFSSLGITVSSIYHMHVTIAIPSFMNMWHFKNTFLQKLYQRKLCKSWTCRGLVGNKSPATYTFLNIDQLYTWLFSRFMIKITHATKYYMNISRVLLHIYEFNNVKCRNIGDSLDSLNAFYMVMRLILTYHIGFIWIVTQVWSMEIHTWC